MLYNINCLVQPPLFHTPHLFNVVIPGYLSHSFRKYCYYGFFGSAGLECLVIAGGDYYLANH